MTSILDNVQLNLVETPDELDSFRRWLGERRPIMGVDIETTGLSLGHDKIRLVQFGDARTGWAIPYEEWRGMIRYVLGTYKEPIVLQHAKFDAGFLQRDGLPFSWQRTHDTLPMMSLVNSMGPRGLKPGAALYLDPSARAGEKALEAAMKKNRWAWATVPINFPLYWGYGCADTVLTAMLAERLWPYVQPFREAYDLEMACERVLCDMEMRGVRIDVSYCEQQYVELEAQLEEVMHRLRAREVNPNAPQQVAEALLADGAELTKRTDKTGQLSVDDEVLSFLAQHGIAVAQDVLEARMIRKNLVSYFSNFLQYRVGDILNPHINQLAARTGRMSVTEPALQTLPRKSLVRDAFIPREGNVLVLADYDNQELRIAAHFSGDEAMLSAFAEGRDLHAETARRLYGEGFTRKQRSTAKNSMFSKAYGAGIDKFAVTAGIPYAEAAAVFATIARLYPGLERSMAQVTRTVKSRANGSGGKEYGWVQLIDGRRLMVKADKAYIGFNALIQGSCAVILKQALVELDNAGLGPYLVLPVHDEIMFDIPIEDQDRIIPEIMQTMTREEFRAQLTVGVKTARRWGDLYREEAA